MNGPQSKVKRKIGSGRVGFKIFLNKLNKHTSILYYINKILKPSLVLAWINVSILFSNVVKFLM
jgi:hypothetical protein